MITNLNQQLTDICKKFKLREKTFESFEELFSENSEENNDLLNGFDKSEINPVFDGYEFNIQHSFLSPTIDTRISLYTSESLIPIGYYKLQVNFDGEIVDDFFVIEREKHSINIINHIQYLNKNLPNSYLRRNHIQYTFVSYISLVGTLFISKNYEGSGRFIHRAHINLTEVGEENFEKDFLKKAKNFLKMMMNYLIEENLISEILQSDFEKFNSKK
ncbi:hypothetical protein [Chryseobacterium sp. JUb7]|uniref:hypothetical protein n=1 Tax=Chryseobacterium sp. JUb7 TaxID=2940599 RepID=UPI0021680D8C|nr:hypothetical protein [Chryseobacterium sp. JUb7]MCS3529746.1 hypothetical protein [Chryseobacterium sp. JUb7]